MTLPNDDSREKSPPLELGSEPAESALQLSDDRLFDLSDEEVNRVKEAANALAEYERATAERERAGKEKENAAASREAAASRRIFIERIGEQYLPYAGYILFVFPAMVISYTQIVQYTDFRFWIGSLVLSLGPVGAFLLLMAADWDNISNWVS
ncbi:hypothetical protein GJR96_07895 [Haloferax sp. MBLA0076]|uniref:Uncharacterized protein n=1 Tax=Haloferax litoreum TaxID=2666140 RepID=A0A6A8GIC3_9EURY|nr:MULTISPECIES: hypothetical protein [Haloferax]KAB1193369.1 hypothetical protein Hfx1148_07890 [Haloferax sp. CBA1148]MRX21877.1 hypothetical protein [Haloferax litoreum]